MFGSGQRSEFKVLERACARIRCDGVFVDVGANIGTASLPALQFFERVIALEPEPRNAALLRANAALNGLDGRVEVKEVACSARGGEVELRLAEGKHGTHAVKRPKEGTASIVVRSVTLDELISASGLTPAEIGLVWMDVEGHEAQALQGAKKLIEARVPLVVEIRARTAVAVLDVVGAAYSSLVDLRAEIELEATDLPAYLAGLRERSGRTFTDVLFLDED
jgi:FkbM family methyltransferase